MTTYNIKFHLLNFCKDSKASTIVEFAFIAPLYLGLILGIAESALTLMFTAAMDFGLQSAAHVIQYKINNGTLAPNTAAIQGQALDLVKKQLFGIHSVVLGDQPMAGKIVIYRDPPLRPLLDNKGNQIFNLVVLRSVYKRLLPSKFLGTLMGRNSLEIQSSAVELTTV
jgi:hypothetical protein